MNRIFIVENNTDSTENFEELLTQFGYQVLASETDVALALTTIVAACPDLILLDVVSNGDVDGIRLAEMIAEKSSAPIVLIVFQTDDFELERIAKLNYHALLFRPFTQDAFLATIKLALLKSSKKKELNNILKIRDKGSLVPINENEVIMLKADGLYTKIFTTSKQYVVRDIIKDVIGKLSDKKFIRVHKSYLVNLDFITAFNAKEVNLGRLVVPIRRGFYKELGDLIVERMSD